jgi:hypothetical protein
MQIYDICMHICSYMLSFVPQVLYTIWCLSKSYEHKNICKKKTWGKKEEKKATAHKRIYVKALVFNAGLLARSQFASGRTCDRPTRSRFSVVFIGPRANAELVHVALYASHAALSMVTLKISLCTNVTLTLGWTTLLMGCMGEGALEPYTEKKESNCQTKKIKIWSWDPQRTRHWPTDVRSQYNLTLNLRDCTANYRSVLS